MLWGDGSFGPTSRGHASAPNKGLREQLAAHGLEIHLCNEYRTTKHTACCQEQSTFSYQRPRDSIPKAVANSNAASAPLQPQPAPAPEKQKQRGLLYCKSPHPHLLHDMTLHLRPPPPPPPHPLHPPPPSSDSLSHHRDHGNAAAPSSQVADSTHSATQPKPRPRPWNRDVSAAINIFLKQYYHAFQPDLMPKCWRHKDDSSNRGGPVAR